MRFIRRIFGAAASTATENERTLRFASQPASFRARLALESLDPRLSPSSLLQTGFSDPTTLSLQEETSPVLIGTPITDVQTAPVIVDFKAILVVGNLFRFTGSVEDAAPGGLTISFGGEPESLQGKTVTTDANGNFDMSILLKVDGSDTGTASAQTVNAAGQSSNLALTEVIAR